MKNILIKSGKKLLPLLLCFLLIPQNVFAKAPTFDTVTEAEQYIKQIPEEFADAPELSSTSAIVMEVKTGTILYAKEATEMRYPASTTKILTGLLAIQNNTLDDIITYSSKAIKSLPPGSSNIALAVGEELSVRDSLYALLLPSANEAANGLAEHTSGSIEAFVDLMNQTMESFGCIGSHFENPNGLHADNHYTCAYDLALIMSHCIQNPTYLQIASAPNYAIPSTNLQPEVRNIRTTDEMMRSYSEYYNSSVICAKTGWTENSGRNLVTYAEKNGLNLVVVVMGTETPHQYLDTQKLLDYAYDNFSLITPAQEADSRQSGFSTPLDMMGNSTGLYELSSDGAVLIPKGYSLEDLTDEFQKEGERSYIQYSLKGYPMGQADLKQVSLINGTAQLNPDVKDLTIQNLISIPLPVVLISVVVLLAVIIVTVLFIRSWTLQRQRTRYTRRKEKLDKKKISKRREWRHGL